MAAAGLISLVMGPPGVRAIRNSSSVCAPASALLDSSTREGFSSECVYGMLRPMPPVPEVPIFTYAFVRALTMAMYSTCTWRMSWGT
jgi:hypothetical protein